MVDESYDHEKRWWTLAVLCLSLVIVVVGNTVLNVALPTLVRELDASSSQLQWIVDSYALVFAGLLFTAGALGDRFGRKQALTTGLVIFGVTSGASAFATSASQLIALRAAHGGGRRPDHAGHPGHPHQRLPARRSGPRPSPYGPVWPAAAPPSARSPAGSSSSTSGGARCSWSTSSSSPPPSSPDGASCPLPRTRPSRPLDPVGALLSIAGLGALLYAIIEAPHHGWTGGPTILFGGAGLAVLAAFAAWELRSPQPMLDLRLFKNRDLQLRRRRHHARLLRHVRRLLRAHPVPPARAGLRRRWRPVCAPCRWRWP